MNVRNAKWFPFWYHIKSTMVYINICNDNLCHAYDKILNYKCEKLGYQSNITLQHGWFMHILLYAYTLYVLFIRIWFENVLCCPQLLYLYDQKLSILSLKNTLLINAIFNYDISTLIVKQCIPCLILVYVWHNIVTLTMILRNARQILVILYVGYYSIFL